jgi:hypothetical protein
MQKRHLEKEANDMVPIGCHRTDIDKIDLIIDIKHINKDKKGKTL